MLGLEVRHAAHVSGLHVCCLIANCKPEDVKCYRIVQLTPRHTHSKMQACPCNAHCFSLHKARLDVEKIFWQPPSAVMPATAQHHRYKRSAAFRPSHNSIQCAPFSIRFQTGTDFIKLLWLIRNHFNFNFRDLFAIHIRVDLKL